jgi:hypothetical protein
VKVLFFFSVLHELYAVLAEQLRRDGVASSFAGIAYGGDQIRVLRARGFTSTEVVAFTDVLDRGLAERREADDTVLREWERVHDATLNLMIACDRRYSVVDRATALRVAELCIRCAVDMLERTTPDVVVSEGIDCLLSYVLYYEARRRGIPLLITYAAPLPRRVAIYGNADNHWERVDAVFADRERRSLTAEQRTEAEQLRQQYIARAVTPSYVKSYQLAAWAPKRVRRDLATARLLLARAWYDREHLLNPTYEGGLLTAAGRRVVKDLRRRALHQYLRSDPAEGQRYALFPLQVEPEVSTSVFAPYCADQVGVIEDIARSLPIDMVLYVKEHPVMMGRRSLRDYRRLARIPNVRLLRPGLNTSALVGRAAAVVVITSTVGWEAVVQERPVILLGNVWYDGCGLVDKISSVVELKAAFARVQAWTPDRERLLKYLSAVIDGTYMGEVDNPHYNPGVLGVENVRHLSNAIAAHLRWLNASGPVRVLHSAG